MKDDFLTNNKVLDIISKETNISIKDIVSRSRKNKIRFARQLYMAFSRLKTKSTTTQIGELVDRDHSTVVYTCKSINFDFLTPNEKILYKKIEKEINCYILKNSNKLYEFNYLRKKQAEINKKLKDLYKLI